MKATDLVRPEVSRIPPYNAGLTTAEVQSRYHPGRISKLGSNESALGPSPDATDISPEFREMMRLYPDPQGRELRRAIADKLSVPSETVILGNGSEDLLEVICRAVIRGGDELLTLYPSFPLHEDYVVLMGGNVVRVDLAAGCKIDVEEFCRRLVLEPRLAMFSNPMNPAGCTLSTRELEEVVAHTSDNTLLVIDEAYIEYSEGGAYGSALDILKNSTKNWLVLRTFSKAYGLAGLRVGYSIAGSKELIDLLNRCRTPFNVNAVGQHAALKAIGDTQHLARVVQLAISERERVSAELKNAGFKVAPSRGNFLFFDTCTDNLSVSEFLLKRGVIVKPWRQPGYTTFLRVSIGTPDENNHFLQAITAAQSELGLKR